MEPLIKRPAVVFGLVTWIGASSNEPVDTSTGLPAGSNTAAAYPPAELAFVILRMVNAEDADYKASESQGCRFEGQ